MWHFRLGRLGTAVVVVFCCFILDFTCVVWCTKQNGTIPKKLETFRLVCGGFRCEGVVVPEGGREGTQGCQLRLETAPVLLYRFLIIGVEL